MEHVPKSKKQKLAGQHSGCMFYFEKKGRYCSLSKHADSLYCGIHRPQVSGEEERVQCPHGNHTVAKSSLAKHVKICPDYVKLKDLESKPYFERGFNKGLDTKVNLPHVEGKNTLSRRRFALIQLMGEKGFQDLLDKIERLHSDLECSSREKSYIEPSSMGASSIPEGDHQRRSLMKKKHSSQQDSIIGNMMKWGFLEHPKTVKYMEFGSGKGYLTGRMIDCVPSVQDVVLIDRTSFKLKVDRNLRDKNLQRVRCDIADFNPSKVENPSAWVAYGKHLCGPATDMTIRCVANQMHTDGCKPMGLAIASCCHHLTSWDQYIGHEFMNEHDISPEEFELMCYMCAWATCGHSSSKNTLKQQDDHDNDCMKHEHGPWRPQATIGRARRIEIGIKCKDLIDRGRILYCRQVLEWNAADVTFVDSSISLENRLLLAKRP